MTPALLEQVAAELLAAYALTDEDRRAVVAQAAAVLAEVRRLDEVPLKGVEPAASVELGARP
jgi:Asp-tRNA(Asn)/Glu-tRNA(Gln) amidotransferase C subunit